MDREATFGGVDPEIFEMIAREAANQPQPSRPINEQEADELGKVIMDLEASGEQH